MLKIYCKRKKQLLLPSVFGQTDASQPLDTIPSISNFPVVVQVSAVQIVGPDAHVLHMASAIGLQVLSHPSAIIPFALHRFVAQVMAVHSNEEEHAVQVLVADKAEEQKSCG